MKKIKLKPYGFVLSLFLALLFYFFSESIAAPSGMTLQASGRASASIAILMAGFWVTEAMPISATALLPILLFPLLGVSSLKEATTPYGHPLIFFFMGGFMMAEAMQRWNLHRRFALNIIKLFGDNPRHLIAGFMAAVAFLSMWVSNTATVVMMLPIALSVTQLFNHRAFAPALLLGIAYAASVGGVGTPIGTPPNALFIGFMERQYGQNIAFADWLQLGLPLVVVFLPLAWFYLVRLRFKLPKEGSEKGASVVQSALKELGKMKQAEIIVVLVFGLVSFLWVFRPLVNRIEVFQNLSDTGIAILGTVLFFLIPAEKWDGPRILDWRSAEKIPWGVLILFGGGLSLASAITDTGVSVFIGEFFTGLQGIHPFLLILTVAIVVIFLTEVTSNTATVATFLPILAAVSEAVQVKSILLLLPLTLAASFAFMLPVATPPNAIVFSSGQLKIEQMFKTGFWLNILGSVMVSAYVYVVAQHI